MSFHFETSPKRVVLYIEKSKDGHVTPIDGVQVVDFACGNNHTVKYLYISINSISIAEHFSKSLLFRLRSIQRNVHIRGDSADSAGLVSDDFYTLLHFATSFFYFFEFFIC